MHPAPPFAILDRGNLRLLLSSPGTQGGGRNRFHLEIDDPGSVVTQLKQKGVHFRSEIIEGVAGKQIILDDPSGNPIELFEYYSTN